MIKRFLYTKMLGKGVKMLGMYVASLIVGLLASPAAQDVLAKAGSEVQVDQGELAAYLTGLFMTLVTMFLNFKKNNGADRVKEDAIKAGSAVKSGAIAVKNLVVKKK